VHTCQVGGFSFVYVDRIHIGCVLAARIFQVSEIPLLPLSIYRHCFLYESEFLATVLWMALASCKTDIAIDSQFTLVLAITIYFFFAFDAKNLKAQRVLAL